MHTPTDPAGISIESRLEALARRIGYPLPLCPSCNEAHAEQLLRFLEENHDALLGLVAVTVRSSVDESETPVRITAKKVVAWANQLAAQTTQTAELFIRRPSGRRHAWALHVRDWLVLQIVDKRAAAPYAGRTEASMWHAFRRVQREVALQTERGRILLPARAEMLGAFRRSEPYNQLRSERPLFIPLRRVYFEAFAAGTKTEEYRIAGRNWNDKNCYPGRPVTLSMGYGTGHRLSGVVTAFRTQEDGRNLPGWTECYGQRIGPAAVISIRVEDK